MNYWEIFSKLCHDIGKKPNPVGEEIGVSTATITKWKNGAIPNGAILLKVADYFNVSTDYLLGRIERPDVIVGNVNGDNSIQANGLSVNGNINLSAGEQKLDELSEELVKNFNVLTTTQKARIIVMIDEMRKGA